ncbi:hypothetical protein M407DRAFT_32688 [Tulasnella calospora MUT 4182]|uniref:Protein kinase domain-containing protein n=1 Tax=Tulasnella calospora MUT 4182 TaxID=1051891 RepID=A0A0C3Q4A7_9AGAM|nr:hypothetical protein M407DRAFT_32688 [Tulasnella calospora MUT 4182]
MATPRVSFASPPPSEPGDTSPASSVGDLDESTPSLTPVARAVFESFAHLVIAPERLTFVDSYPIAHGGRCDVYFAKLDETSQTPKDVAVERLWVPREGDRRRTATRLARQLKAWKGLRHPNVLEFLGYYLSPNYDIAQLISPYKIHGGLRQYLEKIPVAIAQRLGFVRDITAGLDYLHGHSPPVCHGDLNPSNITIDENLNAVLSCFGLASVSSDLSDPSGLTESDPNSGTTRYMSPELIVEDQPKKTFACDILTKKQPFHSHTSDIRIILSLVNRDSPGRSEMLLDLVPDAPKPEYASTLRLLHSYIPLCWEYEPRKRPSISLLRQQAFMFSFEIDAGDSVVATLEELAYLLIPTERLHLHEHSEIGSGYYGEVILGTLHESSPTTRDVHVAVKRLKAVGTRGERVRLAKRLARELNVWAKIKHANVLELIGYYLDEKYESPLLISVFMPNGDVLKYIERFKPDIQQRIAFAKGITAGLACLHNFGPAICHGDLKPANVLIDLHMNAVLCDFGLASFVGGSPTSPGLATTTTLKGTPRYMSPELHLDDDCTHGLESDVWAWACTVFHVLTGSIPYANALGQRQLCMAIVQKQLPGDINLLLPSNFEGADSESAHALRFFHSVIPRCWDFKTQRRPSMSALLSQMSNLSSETVDTASGNEGGGPGGSGDEATLAEASKDPPGGRADPEEVSQEDSQILSGKEHRHEEEATGENVRVDDEQTETEGGTSNNEPSNNVDVHGSTRNTLINDYPQVEKAAEENIQVGQDEATMESDPSDEQRNEDQNAAVDTVTDVASKRLFSTRPFSTFIWPAVFILSLFANICLTYFVLRK